MIEISRRAVLRGVAVTAAGVALTSGAAVPASAAPAAPRNSCTMQTLPEPADTNRTDATAIDPTGRFIVGTAQSASLPDTDSILLWDRDQLTEVKPPEPGGRPVDVNRHGIVIGNGPTAIGGPTQPWKYHNGAQALLPVIDPAHESVVVAINSRGDIAGMGRGSDGGWYGLLWSAAQPGKAQKINTPVWPLVTGLTDDGTIVGNSETDPEQTAWMRTPAGALHTLNSPADARWIDVRTASGQWAVGLGTYPGPNIALRWDLRTRGYTVLDPRFAYEVTDINARGTVLSGSLLQSGDTVRGLSMPNPEEGNEIGGRSLADNGTVAGFHHSVAEGRRAVRWVGC